MKFILCKISYFQRQKIKEVHQSTQIWQIRQRLHRVLFHFVKKIEFWKVAEKILLPILAWKILKNQTFNRDRNHICAKSCLVIHNSKCCTYYSMRASYNICVKFVSNSKLLSNQERCSTTYDTLFFRTQTIVQYFDSDVVKK